MSWAPSSILRHLLRWLPFVAVVFAAAYLWRTGTVTGVRQVSVTLTVLSVLVLLAAFALRAFVWLRLLQRVGVPAKMRDAVSSLYQPVLAKYIPGQVWMILGTAHLLACHGLSLSYATFLCLVFQTMLVASGLLLGILGLLVFGSPLAGSPATWIALAIALGVALVFARPRRIPVRFARWYEQRTLRPVPMGVLPPLSMPLLICMAHWMIMGAAFWIFWRSLGLDSGPSPVFLQPLAINVGVLAFFAPGGLGVREGVMMAYLTLAGLSLADASVAALAARVWFLAHECLLFLVGILVGRTTTDGESSAELSVGANKRSRMRRHL